jgi:hypothetical protein
MRKFQNPVHEKKNVKQKSVEREKKMWLRRTEELPRASTKEF